MKVMKFGGSSLATSSRIKDVARLVVDAARKDAVVVVVSAFQGVTNDLLACARLAERGAAGAEQTFEKIAKRHRAVVDDLLAARVRDRIQPQVDALLGELHDAVHGIRLLGHCPPAALDVVASFGERPAQHRLDVCGAWCNV